MPGSVYKRGNIYWISFSHKGKKIRHSANTDKKREAEKLLALCLAKSVRGESDFFGSPDGLRRFELLDDFKKDCARRKLRDLDIIGYRAGHLRAFFKDVPVEDITERKIDLYIKHRERVGRSTTTINRELQVLGQAMRLAQRKKLIKDVPHIEKFSEKENARQGFFEQHEMEAIVKHLPDYLKDVLRFAYYTGWRKSEILTLEWKDVQGDVIRLKPTIAKNKEGRMIVLVGELAHILDRRQHERVSSCPYVFHNAGIRIKHYNRAWRTAREKAKLPDRLFHDTRRTAVRNMDRVGVPRQVAKQITGHKTDAVYNRYRIVNEQDVREGLAKVFQSHLGHNTGNKINTDLPLDQ